MARKSTNKKNTNRKRQGNKKQSFQLSIEVSGIIMTFLSVIGGFRLGYIGRLLSNLFRFMVGNTDQFLFGIFALCGLVLIVKGKEISVRKHYLIGGITGYLTTLLVLHTISYSSYSPDAMGIINETINRFLIDFQPNQITTNLGGGIIGAVMYTVSRFLVAQIGTYFLIVFLCGATISILFNVHFSDIMGNLRNNAGTVKNSVSTIRQQKATQPSSPQQDVTKKIDSKEDTKKPSFVERMKQLVFEEESDIDQSEQQHYNETKSKKEDVKSTPLPLELEVQDKIDMDVTTPVPENVTTKSVDEIEDTEEMVDFEITAQKEDEDYQLPPISLLNPVTKNDQTGERDIVKRNVQILEDTFRSFGVDAKVIDEPLLGPAVTKFEIKPAVGVKVSKIVNLSDDIALALAAKDIRIEAPIPGKPYIGIEVPNSKTSFISFSDVIQSSLHSDKVLDVPLGRDISGNVRLADLTKMPHMLIAGSTGSGKSVCINGIITSILMKAKPNEVKLMMIDPKMVELNVYNGIPHLLTPVVTNPRKAAQALQKVVAEMEKRYEMFAAMGMRNIDGYNAHLAQYNLETGEDNPMLPYIVVIVDELADLMMVASNEVEDAIIRLAQMARAAGIHMVLATQRPSVDVITGIIKANVPSRIAFAVSSGTDSRTIIDASGAEKLLGRGDMLFMPMGENKPIRVQGAYLTDAEVERVVEFVKNQQEVEYDEAMMPSDNVAAQTDEPEDELFEQVLEMLKDQETVSTSFLQRRFRIGYNRAARLIDDLEMRGYIGAADGSKPRKVNLQNLPNDSENFQDENATLSEKHERFDEEV